MYVHVRVCLGARACVCLCVYVCLWTLRVYLCSFIRCSSAIILFVGHGSCTVSLASTRNHNLVHPSIVFPFGPSLRSRVP